MKEIKTLLNKNANLFFEIFITVGGSVRILLRLKKFQQ